MTLLSMTINANRISPFQKPFQLPATFHQKYSSVNGFIIEQKYSFEINFVNFKSETHCMERKYKSQFEPCQEDWNKMTPNDQGRFV
jgi:hypothetical protein